jgi:hypothetical protein
MDSFLITSLVAADDDEISILKSLENAMESEDLSIHCSVCNRVRFRLKEVHRNPLRATLANAAMVNYFRIKVRSDTYSNDSD